MSSVNITIDYLVQELTKTNYILLGILILFAIQLIFTIYTHFKKK